MTTCVIFPVRAFRAVFVLAAMALLTACQTTSFYTSETLVANDDDISIVVMPGDITLVELTVAGLEEPNAKWTEDATGFIYASLQEEFEARGLNYKLLDEDNFQGEDRVSQQELVKLHSAVGSSIILHRFVPNMKLPVKGDTFDWTLGDQVKVVREKTDADLALFLFVKDQYSSPGRVALSIVTAILGAGVHGGTQAAYASLVDLRTGEVVWFNFLASKTGDLRQAEPARTTVDLLLNDFPANPLTDG